MEIIDLATARALGVTQYYTGKPCKYGHTSLRWVSSRACADCEKIKQKQYYDKNCEQIRIERAAHQTEYRKKNKEKTYQASREWAKINPEKMQSYKRKWQNENKGKVNALTRKRQAAKINRTPKWLTDTDFQLIESFYLRAQELTKETGIQWCVDHIIPLQGARVSGLHVPNNLQVIPAKVNSSKANRYEV